VSRFVDRRFHLVDDLDRSMFLASIARADDRWDWQWLSYALMSSHVHYGLLAGASDPDRFFRSTHTRFAQQFHLRRSQQTLGPVFADRPTLHVVKDADLPRLVAYHHRNPMEAGVVARPSESTWTSHRAYLRLDPPPAWLDVERALDRLGFADTTAGRRSFDEFVTEVDLSDRSRSREATQRDVSSRHGTRLEGIDWQRLIDLSRDVASLPTDESFDARSRRAAVARRLVAIVATRDLAQTYTSVAAHLGMRAGSVFNLVSRSEGAALEVLLPELRRRYGSTKRRK
jgi:hypothetical protein